MAQYDYNLSEIKFNLTLEQIMDLVSDLGGEPQAGFGDCVHCRTICHGGNSAKLYYYDNTKLFKCYTDCGETFDIFELVRKVKSHEENKEWALPKAVQFVADYFGISGNEVNLDVDKIEDWDILERYDRIKEVNTDSKIVELKTYNVNFLKNLPHPTIEPWIKDGITKEAMDNFGIAYEPKQQTIVIPHQDINGNYIGIRQRTMIKEVAEKYGKYRPLKIGKTLYNHPLSFNLYGIYQNKDNIIKAKKAIIFEAEKSVLQLESILGRDNNIGVACCGSSLIAYQVWLLISLGVTEIVVGMDHDFTSLDSLEAKRIIKNLKNIHKKYGQYVTITFMWDKDNLSGYKDSPTDNGADVFFELFENRVNLY